MLPAVQFAVFLLTLLQYWDLQRVFSSWEMHNLWLWWPGYDWLETLWSDSWDLL